MVLEKSDCMPTWLSQVLLILAGFIPGLIAGFLIARGVTKKYLKKNPPINEKMIETLMSGMGRKPSQKQVNQMMKQMNKYM